MTRGGSRISAIGLRAAWVVSVTGSRAPLLRSRLGEMIERGFAEALDGEFVMQAESAVPSELDAFTQPLFAPEILRETHARRGVAPLPRTNSYAARFPIDRRALFPDEGALAVILSAPRTLADLERLTSLQPERIASLLAFLHAMDALASPDDPEAILGVPTGATRAHIRRAYLDRARRIHPDRNPSATPSERDALVTEFQRLNVAYRTLIGRL